MALAWLAEPRGPGPRASGLPAPEEHLLASTPPGETGLGSCVRVSLSGGWAPADLVEEGVVIEVVAAGRWVRSAQVAPPRSTRSSVTRYVVQCSARRVAAPGGQDAGGQAVIPGLVAMTAPPAEIRPVAWPGVAADA